MKVPIAQALTLKVGFLSSLNTVFYGDTTGTVGGRGHRPGSPSKIIAQGGNPGLAAKKVRKGRWNSKFTDFPASVR